MHYQVERTQRSTETDLVGGRDWEQGQTVTTVTDPKNREEHNQRLTTTPEEIVSISGNAEKHTQGTKVPKGKRLPMTKRPRGESTDRGTELPIYIPPIKTVDLEGIYNQAKADNKLTDELQHAYDWLTKPSFVRTIAQRPTPEVASRVRKPGNETLRKTIA